MIREKNFTRRATSLYVTVLHLVIGIEQKYLTTSWTQMKTEPYFLYQIIRCPNSMQKSRIFN